MNKSDFIEHLAGNMDTSKSEARKWLNAFIEGVHLGIIEEHGLRLAGIGSFTHTLRRARMGRNPQTGEQISIPEKWVPKFRAGLVLKKLVGKKKNSTSAKPKGLNVKVSAKGALSVYGLGRFPVTLYKEQWIKLLKKRTHILNIINMGGEINEKLVLKSKQKQKIELAIKLSPKGAYSIYGLGRYPISLYSEQWIKLLKIRKKILDFIELNGNKLTSKAEQ
ncbi:MAG: HU family DNA-binding protein [Oligoflexales bacterium]